MSSHCGASCCKWSRQGNGDDLNNPVSFCTANLLIYMTLPITEKICRMINLVIGV
jgi:hypothetical protein